MPGNVLVNYLADVKHSLDVKASVLLLFSPRRMRAEPGNQYPPAPASAVSGLSG